MVPSLISKPVTLAQIFARRPVVPPLPTPISHTVSLGPSVSCSRTSKSRNGKLVGGYGTKSILVMGSLRGYRSSAQAQCPLYTFRNRENYRNYREAQPPRQRADPAFQADARDPDGAHGDGDGAGPPAPAGAAARPGALRFVPDPFRRRGRLRRARQDGG